MPSSGSWFDLSDPLPNNNTDADRSMQRLYTWWTSKSTKDILQDTLAEVKHFEEWEATVFHLDEEYGYDLWYANLLQRS